MRPRGLSLGVGFTSGGFLVQVVVSERYEMDRRFPPHAVSVHDSSITTLDKSQWFSSGTLIRMVESMSLMLMKGIDES